MVGLENGAIRYRIAPRADLHVITSVYLGQILQVIQTSAHIELPSTIA